MKHLILAMLSCLFISSLAVNGYAQDKTIYQHLGDIGKGSVENGWVLSDVAFKFNAVQKYNYEGEPAQKVYWYDCTVRVLYKMEGYQYKGKYYSKNKLSEIVGYAIVGSHVKYEAAFNKMFPKTSSVTDGHLGGPKDLSSKKKNDPEYIDDLVFSTTKIMDRRAANIETAIDAYLGKENKEREKPKEEIAKLQEDDFWAGDDAKDAEIEEVKITTNIKSKNDDFWSGGSSEPSSSKQLKNAPTNVSDDDDDDDDDDEFWSGNNSTSEGSKEYWEGEKGENAWKITSKNGQQGVVNSATDEILIPFGDWVIDEYDGGIARISVPIESKTICSCHRGSYRVKVTEFGYIDRFGKYLNDTEIVINGKFKSEAKLILVRGDYNSYDKKAADKAFDREKEECIAKGKKWEKNAKNRYL